MNNLLKPIKKIEFKKYSIFIILIALMAAFSIINPVFATLTNMTNLVTQNTYYLIAAVGIAFVMIGGGIDFSVGYQMSLVGVLVAKLITVEGWPALPTVILGIVIGTMLGVFNGIIVTKLKIFPLIATLATSIVFEGISYTISQGKSFRNLPEIILYLSKGRVLGIPVDILLALIFIIGGQLILSKTYFGRFVYATGGNEEAAKLAGIRTNLIKIILYGMCGFAFAVATMDMMAKSQVMSSIFGPGTEFIGLTAGILGGISFKGGSGNIWGLVAGIFVLQVIGNGMQLAGMGTYSQYIVRGLILLIAVGFDSFQNRERKMKPVSEEKMNQKREGEKVNGI